MANAVIIVRDHRALGLKVAVEVSADIPGTLMGKW